jgi:hypothetical protein
MTLPVNHRFDEQVVDTTALSVANGVAGVMRAPFRGIITEIGTMIGSVVSTADATATFSIAGTAITGGAIVITQSGSAIGDLDNAVPSGANQVNEGDLIKVAFTGSGTAGGHVYAYAVVKPA